LKSEKRWLDRLEPYHHQITNLITFCGRLPVTLLADDVGLGKTISAGLVASELIARARVSRILIVCPKLLGPQWQDELKTRFDIPAEIAVGKKLISAEPTGLGAVITTYASVRLYLDKIPEHRFQMYWTRRTSFAISMALIRPRRSQCASGRPWRTGGLRTC
jgi:SNF2 family DNA or RNA helicase